MKDTLVYSLSILRWVVDQVRDGHKIGAYKLNGDEIKGPIRELHDSRLNMFIDSKNSKEKSLKVPFKAIKEV